MSGTNETRQSIITALQGMSGLVGVDVSAASDIHHCFPLAKRKPAIFVIYGGFKANAISQQRMGQTVRTTEGSQTWVIVIVAESFRSDTEASTKTKGLDALIETVRTIRDVTIGPTGQTFTKLFLMSEALYEEQDRPATGGPTALVCHYVTSQIQV